MDISSVGAELTPAQQDEVVADLAFFLEQFGSTRAVRLKLREQRSDLQRLELQIHQLLSRRGGLFGVSTHVPREGDSSSASEEDTDESVNDTMADLAFFLRNFGSTRAVREKLETQNLRLVGLRRTVKWFHERETKVDTGGGSSDVEYLGTENPSQRKKSAVVSQGIVASKDDEAEVIEIDDSDDGADQPSGDIGMDVAQRPSSEEGGHDATAESSEKSEIDEDPAYHSCEIHGCLKQALRRGLCSVHAVGRTCRLDGCDRLVVSGGKGLCRNHAQEQGLAVKGKPVVCKEANCTNWAVTGGSKKGCCFRHGGGSTCKIPGCTKQRQRKGLCASHGGVRECRALGCKTRPVVQGYCRVHGPLRQKKT